MASKPKKALVVKTEHRRIKPGEWKVVVTLQDLETGESEHLCRMDVSRALLRNDSWEVSRTFGERIGFAVEDALRRTLPDRDVKRAWYSDD